MKKIKTVFKIDRETHRATSEVLAQWVLNGEGIATIKFDGSSCLFKDGKLWKRFDAKHGKTPPEDWVPCEEKPDEKSGHWPGWLPVAMNAPENRSHKEAFLNSDVEEGATYELMGPKVQKNSLKLNSHKLVRHGSEIVEIERTREAMIKWLENNNHEGLVFHHPDGRMAKLRRKDFGIVWNK